VWPLFRSLESRQPAEYLEVPRSFPREPRLEDDSERLRRNGPRWEVLPRWLDPYGLDAPFEALAGLFESPWRLFGTLPEAPERLEPS
jgi:hypothetical protein